MSPEKFTPAIVSWGIMKADLKTFNIVGAVTTFIGLPVLFYILVNFPSDR